MPGPNPYIAGDFPHEDVDPSAQKLHSHISSLFGSSFFGGSGKTVSEETIRELIDVVSRVERKLDLIFGDHALIDGRFVSVARLLGKGKKDE